MKDSMYGKNVRDIEEIKDIIKGVILNITREMCVNALNCTVVFDESIMLVDRRLFSKH